MHCLTKIRFALVLRKNTLHLMINSTFCGICIVMRVCFRHASKLLLRKSTIVHSLTDSEAGTTLSCTAQTNKWIPVPQPTRERQRYLMKQHTTMGPDTKWVSCGPSTKLFTEQLFFALLQLKSLERRLRKDADLKTSYTKTVSDDFSKSYIVQVDKIDCFKVDQSREWSSPHHPVVHPHNPGKVRKVLNGAATFHGQSLNSALLAGPDLLQSLIHILFRFRLYSFAVSADIEGMFLQVGVIPCDRPSLRFLWREHPAAEVAVYEYVRHIFGSKDSPIYANYALKRTATDIQANFPDAARSVHNNFYMDDYLESSPTANEASNKAKDLVKMLALGGFKLTKFVSNVPSSPIEVDPSSDNRTTEEKENPTAEKFSHVLGLKWNHSTDTLVVSRGTSPNTDRNVTQRVVLSLVSAVYDPIGLVAPFTIKARLVSKKHLEAQWPAVGRQLARRNCNKVLGMEQRVVNFE